MQPHTETEKEFLMTEEYIVRNCAPTLAGIKTASMFSCPCCEPEKLRNFLKDMNRRLNPKGIRLLPLKVSEKRALIYVYRPERLSADICNTCAYKLLNDAGYDTRCCQRCLVNLINKLRYQTEFPHEIGLFLGYPPEDVQGFILNKAQDYKLSGLWKVYGDVEDAKKRFELFKKCDRIYFNQWSQGKDIEQLTVAA
jgi:hypothetical protein